MFIIPYNDKNNNNYNFIKCNILRSNHFIGLDFNIYNKMNENNEEYKDNNNENNKVIAHLLYGNNKRIRFYPEILINIIPRLFVKPLMNEYKFLKLIYSNNYKHGF